jgi:hypothetical protein
MFALHLMVMIAHIIDKSLFFVEIIFQLVNLVSKQLYLFFIVIDLVLVSFRGVPN